MRLKVKKICHHGGQMNQVTKYIPILVPIILHHLLDLLKFKIRSV